MGNSCCSGQGDEPGYMIGKNEGGSSPDQQFRIARASDKKIKIGQQGSHKELDTFMKKHDVQELVFNSKAGLYESYLCIEHQRREGGPGPGKPTSSTK